MIHPTAVIDSKAEIASDVCIGAYSVIGEEVRIDSGTEVAHHVVINGPTRIGKKNHIFQFSSIGDIPQDKKYAGEDTLLEIGDENTIREFVTLNRGTIQGGGVTKIGDHNWIMAYVHIAHDCIVGNHTVFANNASLAGHVQVEDNVILGGFTLVHQFCNLGCYSFCAKASGILKDVPPYVMVGGYSAKPHGLNSEGLRRNGFSEQSIQTLKQAYRVLYRSKLTLNQAMEQLLELAETGDEVENLVSFLRRSQRGIVR